MSRQTATLVGERQVLKSIYIETTIVSYYTARPSPDVVTAARQEATRELWPKLVSEYDSYVSALVREEAGKGNKEQATLRLRAIETFPILETDETAIVLASKILEGRGIPEEYPEDALHIAVAAVNGIDVLVTWNFAHLNNPFTRMMVRQLVENAGYRCPELCSPDELLEAV
jgi:predicted nucleic acid-binding protein